MKAAMIYLNTKARTIGDLESAMVIRSLYREEHLSQVEIATLLDRHKSFVCRRLQLVEKLSDEVLEHLKLGLINITTGRELSRLPAGNQADTLSTVLKYGFTGSETSELVRLLLEEPRWNHDMILRYPESILTDRIRNGPAGIGIAAFTIAWSRWMFIYPQPPRTTGYLSAGAATTRNRASAIGIGRHT